MLEGESIGHFGFHEGHQPGNDPGSGRQRMIVAEGAPVGLHQDPRVVIGLSADHHAVDLAKLGLDIRPARESAVDDDLELGELLLESMHIRVFERRNLAILLG